MPDRRLTDAFGGFAAALLPDPVLRQERATRSVINLDATVDPDAIGTALSLPIYLDVAGALALGNGIGGPSARRRVPQAVTVWQVRLDLGTAPTSPNECTLWLVADGVRVVSVSAPPGETVGVSSAAVDLAPGALLTLDCTAANGAANAAVMVAVRPRSG